MKEWTKWLFRAVLIVLILCAAGGILLLNGTVTLNHPDKTTYPIRGVDVSAWQGEIDWPVLAAQDIKFAFIKATEGSNFVDRFFAHNWRQAHETKLAVGAYHFFSYNSPGDTQADLFINTVPKVDGALPPVVDVEFYGGNEKLPPDRDQVSPHLREILVRLETHYGKKPILYATMKSYQIYLQGDYEDYPIWIRDILRYPSLPDGRQWTFWQYSNRGKLEGYQGDEPFIDFNVFYGSLDEWNRLVQ